MSTGALSLHCWPAFTMQRRISIHFATKITKTASASFCDIHLRGGSSAPHALPPISAKTSAKILLSWCINKVTASRTSMRPDFR